MTDIANYDRMFLYVWSERDKPDECKFGERWVHANTSAEQSVRDRVRDSLAVRKDLIKSGVVKIDHYWDVTNWAKTVGRCRDRAHMDDYVRAFVGHRKNTTGEIHTISSEDLILRVNRRLAMVNQPLPPAALSSMQASMAEQVLERFDGGDQVVLAELCARFGKTIWSGAVASELRADLVVVASYVKTVFASFAKDLTSFQQWANYSHVDTQSTNWQTEIASSLAEGRPVVAYLSMAPGGLRNTRINWLMSRKVETLLVVDEADFGSHTANQALPLRSAISKDHRVLIMTGTNSDRASKFWNVSSMVSVTYPELLVQKRASQAALASGVPPLSSLSTLTGFQRDLRRDTLMPDISLYQLDLSEPVAQSVARGEFDDPEMKLLPSWAKFAAHPQKSKGFFVRILETVFLGKHQVEAANADLQTLNWFGRDRSKVAMMFMPHQTGVNSGALRAVGQIAAQALPAWRVVTLGGGDIRVANQRVRNHNAERTTREEIERATKLGQNVLIIASQMAQRSFSIPEITELYLAYDAGQAGATIQKMSRVLTPGASATKVGKIISLSFDPNRDDKFDTMLLETAKNMARRQPHKSPAELMSEILSTIDIWQGGAHSGTRVVKDEFLRQALARNSVAKVIGAVADLKILSKEEIRALASSHVSYSRVNPVAHTPKGKAKEAPIKTPSKLKGNTDARLLQLARERIVGVAESTDMIIGLSGCSTLMDALDAINEEESLQEELEGDFGMPWPVVNDLYRKGVINPTLLGMMLDRTV